MASSRKPRSSDLVARVGSGLARHVPRGARLTLALSGGVDSIALLDILATLAPRHPLSLDCLHVDHGISPHASAWARFARAAARRYGLRCAVRKADLAPHRALGLEGAARAARYALFAGLRSDLVALAQHEDDQAETVLLQLVRGAGPGGLAAMPTVRVSARGPAFFRPFLETSRAEIEAYARGRGLEWVEDESNADTRRARNLVRLRVVPLLRELNPQASANLARSAALAAEANEIVQAVAAEDVAAAADDGRLAVAALAALPRARARNALRWTLTRAGFAPPVSVRLDEALRQILEARDDAAVRIELGEGEIRRFRGRVWVIPRTQPVRPGFRATWPGGSTWRVTELGGILRLKRSTGRGLAASEVLAGRLEIRVRGGGERFRPDPRRPQRELKTLLQEAGVPPWERERLPLLYCGGRLAWVPGIGVASALCAAPREAGILPVWERCEAVEENRSGDQKR